MTMNGSYQDLTVSDEQRLNGVAHQVTVVAGGRLSIAGVVHQMRVEEGGWADVTGVVHGTVRGSGAVFVAVGAVVNDRQLAADGSWSRERVNSTISSSTPRFRLASDGSTTLA